MSDIENTVYDIVTRVALSRRESCSLERDTPLTGSPLFLSGYEMVYVVLELMDIFQITFRAEDFADYRFNTINGIIAAVRNHIRQCEDR